MDFFFLKQTIEKAIKTHHAKPRGIDFFVEISNHVLHKHPTRTQDPIDRTHEYRVKNTIMGVKLEVFANPTVKLVESFQSKIPLISALITLFVAGLIAFAIRISIRNASLEQAQAMNEEMLNKVTEANGFNTLFSGVLSRLNNIDVSMDLEQMLAEFMEVITSSFRDDIKTVYIHNVETSSNGPVMQEIPNAHWCEINNPKNNEVLDGNVVYEDCKAINEEELMAIHAPLIYQGKIIAIMTLHIRKRFQQLMSEAYVWSLANDLAIMKGRKQIRDVYVSQGTHDKLTGLPNRDLFHTRAKQAINTRCNRDKEDTRGIFIFFIDLDYFKSVNDTLGHAIGDGLLVQVARRLEKCIKRKGDTVARLSGDEFSVLLTDVDYQGAIKIAISMLMQMIRKFDVESYTTQIGASIGIVAAFGMDVDAALKAADTAMYFAKNKGRNRVVIPDGKGGYEIVYAVEE